MYYAPGISSHFIKRLADHAQHLHGEDGKAIMVWDGRQIAQFPTYSDQDVYQAIARAKKAQAIWNQLSVTRRATIFHRLAKLIWRHHHRFASLSQVLCGSSRLDAEEELVDACNSASAYGSLLTRLNRPQWMPGLVPFASSLSKQRVPVGVVAIFTLADYPVSYNTVDVLQPVAAGNAVIQFVPAQAALAAYAIRELAIACGIPADLWQIMPGNRLEPGFKFIPYVDHVTYIGNSADGEEVASRAAKSFVGTSLFLSNRNHAVVAADADLDVTIPCVARAAFTQSGNSSAHIEKVWVHRSLFDQFVNKFKAHIRDYIRLGKSFDHTYTFGSVYSEFRAQRCEEHVRDALALGATVILGGKRRPDIGPWFFEPTVLTDVPAEALVASEETYGPVLTLQPFDDLSEPAKFLADSYYGHLLMVFTQDQEVANYLSENSIASMVAVNDSYVFLWSDKRVPVTSLGETGNGIRFGIEGLKQYSTVRVVNHQRFYHLEVGQKVPPEGFTRKISPLLYLTMAKRSWRFF